MIAFIRGTIFEKSHQLVIVEAQGIGYAVAVSDDRLYKKDQQVTLRVYTHWNQENGPQLYGFDSSDAKLVFQLILTCTGCGPKIGLAVLSAISPYEFLNIISIGDAQALSQVNGIGPKKAELMIMQLKDKIAKIAFDEFHPAQQTRLNKIKQISAALSALHYKPSEITRAVDTINQNENIEQIAFDELLKKALSVLAKNF